MPRILIALTTCLAMLALAAGATADTKAKSAHRAFGKLSPGDQKIARSLYSAQKSGQSKYTLDQIAAMKQSGKGWGVIFKEMKADGRIPSDVKNLGQLVSGKYKSSGGTTITRGTGRSDVVGKPGNSGNFGHGAGGNKK